MVTCRKNIFLFASLIMFYSLHKTSFEYAINNNNKYKFCHMNNLLQFLTFSRYVVSESES